MLTFSICRWINAVLVNAKSCQALVFMAVRIIINSLYHNAQDFIPHDQLFRFSEIDLGFTLSNTKYR